MSIRDLFDRAGGVTRRKLAAGTVAVAGAAAAATALSGCSGTQSKLEGEPQVVTDSSQVVNVLDGDYKSGDLGLTISDGWTLPLGTLLWHSEGAWAAAMMAPESALHPNTIGAFSLSAGSLTTLMSAPTKGSAYGFHDVRLGTGVMAWIEMNYRTLDWVLLAQPFGNGAISGAATELDSGDANWEPPQFSCTGTMVVWQKMPMAKGAKSSEASNCLVWKVGDSKGSSVWESKGRFATHPRVSDGTLAITPRVRVSEGTYYGITALDLTSSNYSQLAQLVLPSSVKPFEAVYTGSQFVFSIEAAYESAGSLGNMGTFLGSSGGPYVYFSREPAAQVAFNGSHYLIKTQSAHYAIDTDSQKYQGISSPDRSLGLGDFTASEGACSTALVFATVRDDKGKPSHVLARLISL